MNKTATVTDLATLNPNFPPPPHPEVLRNNVVNTLKNLLQDTVYAATIEGPEGIGKTSVLAQFVRRNLSNAISIFTSAANRLSYDADLIRIDVTVQVYWALTGDVLDRARYDPALLKIYYAELQRAARRQKSTVYFIIDGIEELETANRNTLLQQLADILPIGIPQFRFLLSGDESLYKDLIGPRLTLKSYPLTEFSVEETRTLFQTHSLTVEMASEITNICRGMPGRLTGVLRAMERGVVPEDFVENAPTKWPEFFEIDWRQVEPNDEVLKRILALLAHDLKPHTVDDVAVVLRMSPEEVRARLATINFLTVEPETSAIRFANSGLRKYIAEQLQDKRVQILKLLIKGSWPNRNLPIPY
jgi:hypothetical protein